MQHATWRTAYSVCFAATRLPRYTPAVPATSTSKACLCVQHTQACPFRACGNSRPNSAHLVEEVRAVVRLVGADQCQRVRPVCRVLYLRACVRACVRAHVFLYVWACLSARARACARVCVRVCVFVCVCARARARAGLCMRGCAYACAQSSAPPLRAARPAACRKPCAARRSSHGTSCVRTESETAQLWVHWSADAC